MNALDSILKFGHFQSLFFSFCLVVLIDKDNSPKWNPSTLNGVTQEKVEHYFETLGDRELVL